MKISDLFEAAIPYLEKERFSCKALSLAALDAGLTPAEATSLVFKAQTYMEAWGLRACRFNITAFYEFETRWGTGVTPESQQARALWLTMLAMLAKEEGL